MLPATPPVTGRHVFDDTPLKPVYVVDDKAKVCYQDEKPWDAYEIVSLYTGMDGMEIGTSHIVGYYDLSGRLLTGNLHGTLILRYSNGSSQKVMLK